MTSSLRDQARANRPRVDSGQSKSASEPTFTFDIGEDPEAVSVLVAWNRVMRFCQALPKGSVATVTTKGGGSFTYRYRGVDDVVSLAGKALREFGVIIVPTSIDVQHKVGNPTWCKVDVEYAIMSIKTVDGVSVIRGKSCGEALDFGDKALVKALTQAYRVFLTTALTLPTYDVTWDSDANAVTRPVPPSPLELRDEMMNPEVTTPRLKAIYAMLQRDQELAQTIVPTGEGRAESLWDLNVRIGKERKAQAVPGTPEGSGGD